jgi:hypothetical protein
MSTRGSQIFGFAVVVDVALVVVGTGVGIGVGTGVGIGVGTGVSAGMLVASGLLGVLDVGTGPISVGPGFVCSVVVGVGIGVGIGVLPPGGGGGGAPGDPGGGGAGLGPALGAGPGVVLVTAAFGALAFWSHVCWRRSGVTHTASPSKASRQTYPGLQVRGPYAPPLGSRLLAALAFSAAIRSATRVLTHTRSPG